MKKHYNIYVFAGILLLWTSYAQAQMPRLSQFWLAPQLNTPAAMGGSDYMQLSSHFRQQALSEDVQYRSFVLAAQMPLYYSSGKRFGTAGLMLLQDRTGPQQMLVTNGLVAAYSYDVSLSSKSHLLGAVQLGYYMRSFNWSKVRTDSQWQWGNYNPGLNTGENWSDERSGAFQANAGIGYYQVAADGSSSLHISAGAYNINRGSFQYLHDGEAEALPLIVTASIAGLAYKSPFFDLSPMLRWQQEAGLHDFSGGVLLRKGLKEGVATEKNHIGLGVVYSLQQSSNISLQFAQPSFMLAIGYDLAAGNTSKQARNALEASLSWRLNRATRKGTNTFREIY